MISQGALSYFYVGVIVLVTVVTIRVFLPTEDERGKIKRTGKAGQQATGNFLLITAMLTSAIGIGATLLLLYMLVVK